MLESVLNLVQCRNHNMKIVSEKHIVRGGGLRFVYFPKEIVIFLQFLFMKIVIKSRSDKIFHSSFFFSNSPCHFLSIQLVYMVAYLIVQKVFHLEP